MIKLDKDRNVTQEYLDFVSNLERQDLETFYIGADLLVDRLNSIINKAIEYLEKADDNENSYGDYEIHYEVKKELLDILKGVEQNGL